MDSHFRQYLFGLVFLGFGIYEFTKDDPLEAVVYLTAGLAFIFNNLISEPRLYDYKKILVIITWVLIIAAAITFLYVLQFKFL
jgi:hypothetical protein